MVYNQTSNVYSVLREKILKGELKPAQSITEAEVVQTFGVSRTTAKKAFLMLQSENLIEIKENRGARVRSFNIDEITDFLNVRALLEGYVAELTAPTISDETLNMMKAILDEMEKLYHEGDLMQYSEKNKLLHNCIYQASPSRVAADLISDIRTQISRYNFKTILVPGRVRASFQEHRELIQAYSARDPQWAKEVSIRHVNNLLKTLHDNYNILFM